MNEQEVRALLAITVAYDNRRPSQANITAWWEQADRNRWTFDAAREAIHEHHANSTDFLMPAHVTAIIRNRRTLPPRAVAALDRAPNANPERISSLLGELGRRLGWNHETAQSLNDPALTVDCPHCDAGPGQRCARLVTRGPHRGEHRAIRAPHPSRVDLAAGGGTPTTTTEGAS